MDQFAVVVGRLRESVMENGKVLSDARRKLIAHYMAAIAIPTGTANPVVAGMAALAKPGNIIDMYQKAERWVEGAVAIIKTAPDNPYGDDDEAILCRLLEQVERRKEEVRVRRDVLGLLDRVKKGR